ncbi:MAG: lipoyl synthase [Vallitaleaceae bacterium]|jgi:lipoic acid synthetase|nr:lipoyl synthase [Vallitaleaceae bacterium]
MIKPEWLKIKGSAARDRAMMTALLSDLSLNTVCHEAACPNIGECFGRKTATFMILGTQCTRGCKFCNVLDGRPDILDPHEPVNIAIAVKRLNLKHVVITSVTRDDLEDGGAGHFALTINEVRKLNPDTTIEVLIPDMKMNTEAIDMIINAKPDIIAHNIETVASLYEAVRPDADYEQSLQVLDYIKKQSPSTYTKSGMMLGLGEQPDQIKEVLIDLKNQSCDFLTIGQYLAPSKNHHPVIAYIHPDQFKAYELLAYKLGFHHVASGPLVRSSYHADEAMATVNNGK